VQEELSRCGYRCDICLAYRPNVESHPPNQQVLSDGWHKYFGFRIPPEEIICDGCMADSRMDKPKLIDRDCPVRSCVTERALTNCAACDEMHGCGKLAQRLVVYEDIAAGFSSSIPEEDRQRFILPYENNVRLCRLVRQR
jgi:hypothetical protein